MIMDIEIKEMELTHLEEIKSILETEFDNFWNYNTLKEELLSSNSKYLVAIVKNRLDTEIVGFAGIKISLDEADIMNIVTKKTYRKNGVGRSLLYALIQMCNDKKITSIFLEVNESNLPAISLYKSCGFTQIGIRKNYYQGKNGISMKLDLKNLL